MPAAERTISINQPPSAVFPVVADGLKGPLWRPGVTDVALVSGSGVGAVYRQGVRGPGGRRIDADYEITAFEPDRRVAFRVIAGLIRPLGEYELEAIGGATALTFRLDADRLEAPPHERCRPVDDGRRDGRARSPAGPARTLGAARRALSGRCRRRCR
jgi:hypothetical protein